MINAPIRVIPEIAFAPDIKGVCRVGGTFVISSNPTNEASTKIKRLNISSSMVVSKSRDQQPGRVHTLSVILPELRICSSLLFGFQILFMPESYRTLSGFRRNIHFSFPMSKLPETLTGSKVTTYFLSQMARSILPHVLQSY